MMQKTHITLVRHGETEWNVAMRLQGMQDSNLTKNGMLQAKLAAESLRRFQFQGFVSSDLGRAVKTAESINIYHNLEIELNSSIRERNFGVMEGLTREELFIQHPKVYHGYMERNDTYTIPRGESLVSFYKRVSEGLNAIAERYQGKNILIVSHGGVLDCIMRMIFNYPLSAPRHFSIFNGSINTFSVNNRVWFLEQWGNVDHQQVNSISLDI
jgi:2,3-bisphosphoglycerate-dependent phosphoglycerate mutase